MIRIRRRSSSKLSKDDDEMSSSSMVSRFDAMSRDPETR